MIPRLLFLCLSWAVFAYSWGQSPKPFDIIMDELLPDPNPVQGLPNAEFIELKNQSSAAIDLKNWQLGKRTSLARITTDFNLEPDSLVIICSVAAMAEYAGFGAVVGVSHFPALGNESDTVLLVSPEGFTIHALAYDPGWFRNDIKKAGGWSLEMIDTHYPCSGAWNWRASVDPRGGTPGQINSVQASNPDLQAPGLVRSYTPDHSRFVLVFDEPLDSISASEPSNYEIEGMGIPKSCQPLGPLFTSVRLEWPIDPLPQMVYSVRTSHLKDCAGNEIAERNQTQAGLALEADTLDLVINEILFNPASNGYDYVELYNRSHKIIDLQKLFMAKRNVNGAWEDPVALSPSPFLIFPGQYDVFTENPEWVQSHYGVRNPIQLLAVSSIPSLPDDRGSILILDAGGRIIDELHYDHQWHLPLVANEEGIALERIDYNRATQDPANWTSAASTAGFGTPTYQNSEFHSVQSDKTGITIEPRLFSPDQDGYNDYCYIQFRTEDPGWIANITLFDASGRPVRYLVQNETLSGTGQFRWDGLDDGKHPLPFGVYIVFTEIFNLRGQVKRFRNAVILARKI